MRVGALVLVIIVVINGCTTRTKSAKRSNLEYTFLADEAIINPRISGYWKSLGGGYILDATADSIQLYSYTKNFCYKEKNDYLEGLLNAQSQFLSQGDTISIFLTDFGDKTSELQPRNDFVRISSLPDCISFSELQQSSPTLLFNLFIETLKENYAFSKERNLDWSAISEEFRTRLSDETTQEELFQLMGEVVRLTKDHHTKIIAQDGRTLQFTGVPSAEIVMDDFNSQSEVEDLNDYFNLFFKTNYENISDSLLHGKGQKVANKKIEWGSLDDKIGYIHIHSFAGFAPSSISRKQQLDTINYYMKEIISDFIDKDAIIVDVSFNFGGYDASGLTIASYFTDKPMLAYTSQVYSRGVFQNESELYVNPSEKVNFTKPVYLLTTDISRSAAESFAMMMKALPNVKLVGMNTLGILSGMLGKSIGEFYFTSSNQRLLSPDNEIYEVSGVKPDIELEVFTKENVFEGHKDAVREVMDIIERISKSQ
ncbi:MAG: S41 family peptidase [Bacteroidota bacterium]